jgi:hypothetical protein
MATKQENIFSAKDVVEMDMLFLIAMHEQTYVEIGCKISFSRFLLHKIILEIFK